MTRGHWKEITLSGRIFTPECLRKFTSMNNIKSQSLLFLFTLISVFFFQPAACIVFLFGIFHISTIIMKTTLFVFNATLHFGGGTFAARTNLIMVLAYLTLFAHCHKLFQSHVMDGKLEMRLGVCGSTGFNHSA